MTNNNDLNNKYQKVDLSNEEISPRPSHESLLTEESRDVEVVQILSNQDTINNNSTTVEEKSDFNVVNFDTATTVNPTKTLNNTNSTDGVFSNMSAKPEVQKVDIPETLPGYVEAMQEPSPPQFENIHGVPTSDIIGDDVLIEGLPVGGLFSFFWSLLVGFLLTYLLHLNHAGKYGSFAGLGVTFLQYGFYLHNRKIQENLGEEDNSDDNSDFIPLPFGGAWISYVLMLFGWVIILKSCAEYIRVKKIQSSVLQSTQANAV